VAFDSRKISGPEAHQKSHTLIVIDEDQVIGWYQLIDERGARRAIRLCFFRSFFGIANGEIDPQKKQRMDPPSALLSSNFSHISGYPTCVTWLLL
jgi:hypothetical protein